MFVKYTFNAGWTATNFQNDLIGLLTDTFTIAGCSSACNIGQSTQSGSPSQFTLVDQVAGNYFVLSAPDADNFTTKYCKIAQSTSQLLLAVAEGWTVAGHVPTNLSATKVASIPAVGAAGTVFIATNLSQWLMVGNAASTTALWGEILRESPLMSTSLAGVYPQSQFITQLSTSGSVTANQTRTRVFTSLSNYTTPGTNTIAFSPLGGSSGTPSADVYDGNGASFIQSGPAFVRDGLSNYLGRVRGGIKFGHTAYVGATWGDVIYVDSAEHLIVGANLVPVI